MATIQGHSRCGEFLFKEAMLASPICGLKSDKHQTQGLARFGYRLDRPIHGRIHQSGCHVPTSRPFSSFRTGLAQSSFFFDCNHVGLHLGRICQSNVIQILKSSRQFFPPARTTKPESSRPFGLHPFFVIPRILGVVMPMWWLLLFLICLPFGTWSFVLESPVFTSIRPGYHDSLSSSQVGPFLTRTRTTTTTLGAAAASGPTNSDKADDKKTARSLLSSWTTGKQQKGWPQQGGTNDGTFFGLPSQRPSRRDRSQESSIAAMARRGPSGSTTSMSSFLDSDKSSSTTTTTTTTTSPSRPSHSQTRNGKQPQPHTKPTLTDKNESPSAVLPPPTTTLYVCTSRGVWRMELVLPRMP